ncbi:MAG: glycosyl transferase family 2, partial [Deltaproteobacteria bacterium RIFCSPLOWO2_02_FULL_53_8]
MTAHSRDTPAAVAAPDLKLRQNNFDLLRFLFAFVVFLVHTYVLSGAEALSVLSRLLSSEIAVKSFFVVSGFLIFMSYENSRDIKSYFVKRARRIYPAYFAIVIICAVLGSVFSVSTWGDYFSPQVVKYVSANLLFLNFLQPNLPGLFESNSLQAVNGALWTLKIEVMFYLFVPLAVIAFRKLGRMPVLVTLYICSVIYSVVMEGLARKTGSSFYLELQRQLPGQLAFFIAGAAGYYYFQYLAKYAAWLVVAAVAAFALQAGLPWAAIQPAALGVLVVYFACVMPCLGNFGKYGDFSYGIYIIHFPILQTLIAYGWFKESPWAMLVVAGSLVMTVAFLLWHFIEKPFLRKSSHYVAANHG